MEAKTAPGARPLQGVMQTEVAQRLERALADADGVTGAHCVHELWMRGEMSMNVERALERLWARAGGHHRLSDRSLWGGAADTCGGHC